MSWPALKMAGSFPQFIDGNVEIIVLPDIYRLHSSRLGTCSRLIKLFLERQQYSLPPNKQHQNPSSRRVTMNLVGASAHKYGALEMLSYDESNQDIDLCSFPTWPHKTRHIWSNIFKIFYNLPPIIDNDGDESILENCQALVDLADELLSFDVVSRALSTALLRFDQQLYKLISQDPISWITFAVRIQSRPIFRESMIHLVGKWGLLDEQRLDLLPRNVYALCIQKINDLNNFKKGIELQVVNSLPRPRSDSANNHKTNSIFEWIALTFYQHWLCQSFAENRNYHAPDGGAAFYRAIATGGDAHLNKLEQDIIEPPASFEASTSSTKGLNEIKRDLDELKKGMRGAVSILFTNEAKYDPAVSGELPYLTCCKVSEEEIPLSDKMIYNLANPHDASIANMYAAETILDPTTNQTSMIDMHNSANFSNNHAFSTGLGPQNTYIHQNRRHLPLFEPLNGFSQQQQQQQPLSMAPIIDPALDWSNTMVDYSAFSNSNSNGEQHSVSDTSVTNANDFYQPPAQTQAHAQAQVRAQAPTTSANMTPSSSSSIPYNADPSLQTNVDYYMSPMTGASEYVHTGSDGSMAFL